MRFIQLPAALAGLLFAAGAMAENAEIQDKIKTGILPSGSFYSIYEVGCADSGKTHVAMLDRHRNWCLMDGADLDCFRAPQTAAERACAARNLELAGDGDTSSSEGQLL